MLEPSVSLSAPPAFVEKGKSTSLKYRGLSWGGIVGLLILGMVAGYKWGFKKHTAYFQELTTQLLVLKEQNASLVRKTEELQQTQALLEHDLQIQIEAKKNLASHLRNLQAHNIELGETMALYQTVTGAKATTQGVEIKTFKALPLAEPQTFRYSIVLSKKIASHEFAKGAVSMVIMGKINDIAMLLPVKYVDSGRNDGLPFQFRHVQELSGELSLPPGFLAEEVLLTVKNDTNNENFQQQFAWLPPEAGRAS